MSRLMIAGVVLGQVILLPPQDPPQTMRLLTPPNANLVEVQAAAKVLEKRCRDFGFKGILVQVAGTEAAPELEVICETGITQPLRGRIEEFGRRPCAKMEFAVGHIMSAAEVEQFKDSTGCPPGTSWVTGSDGRRVLISNETRKDVTGRIVWRRPTQAEKEEAEARAKKKAEATKKKIDAAARSAGLAAAREAWPRRDFREKAQAAEKRMREKMEAEAEAERRADAYKDLMEPHIILPGDVASIAKNRSKDGQVQIRLLIDGSVQENGDMSTLYWKENAQGKVVEAKWVWSQVWDDLTALLVTNPLPFALRPVK